MSSLQHTLSGLLPPLRTAGHWAASALFLSLGLAATVWRRLRHGEPLALAAAAAATPPQPPLAADARVRRTLSEGGPIVVGVCAMDKKARSQPMNEMLHRLTSYVANGRSEFRVVYFGDDTLLNRPIEEWPLCDALIAFYSSGFPLAKAQQYAQITPRSHRDHTDITPRSHRDHTELSCTHGACRAHCRASPCRDARRYAALRRPYVFNNLHKQELLFDRRKVYALLESIGVKVPKYVCYDAADAATTVVDDNDEYLCINGVRVQKPLAEKPLLAVTSRY